MAGTHPSEAQSPVAGPAMSVAMPDCPANSPGESDRERDPESDPATGSPRVRVMLPLPLPEPLDYLMPEGAAFPEPGSFVRVSLGPRRMIGVVWDPPGDRKSVV